MGVPEMPYWDSQPAGNLKYLISFCFQLDLNFKQKLHPSLSNTVAETGNLFLGGIYKFGGGHLYSPKRHYVQSQVWFSPDTEPEFFCTGFRYVSNISNCLF